MASSFSGIAQHGTITQMADLIAGEGRQLPHVHTHGVLLTRAATLFADQQALQPYTYWTQACVQAYRSSTVVGELVFGAGGEV